MNVLATGIFSLYNAGSDLKTNLTGGLHYELPKQDTVEPYGVFNLIVGRPDYLFTEEQEIVTVQFDIYATTDAIRATLYGNLTSLYDDSRPTATGYTSIIMERRLEQFLREGDQNQIFRAIVEYEAMIEKSR